MNHNGDCKTPFSVHVITLCDVLNCHNKRNVTSLMILITIFEINFVCEIKWITQTLAFIINSTEKFFHIVLMIFVFT